jgi:hypothetical protein
MPRKWKRKLGINSRRRYKCVTSLSHLNIEKGFFPRSDDGVVLPSPEAPVSISKYDKPLQHFA